MTMIVSTRSASSADSLLGDVEAAPALERERPRDDADRECPDLVREIGDDRRGARARAATLAGGHEHHVCALQHFLQLVARLECSRVPDLRISAGAQTAGHLVADVDLHVRVAHQQRLRIGVDADELDAGEARVDHPVDGVRAAATDADDLDHGYVVTSLSSHSPPTSISTLTRT